MSNARCPLPRVRRRSPGPPLKLALDLDAYLAGQRSAALLVLHDGKLRLERYGLDFDAARRWTSFSVAKSITSLLVGAAIRDGAIRSMDDKVSDYIPQMKGSAYDEVSIRQRLTMTSWVRWIFVLDGARVDGRGIVPEGWLAEATTERTGIGVPGRGYGYQWWTYADGSFAARGIFGQGLFVDPKRRIVIASNANWAGGARDPVASEAREAFYRAVQRAIDDEGGPTRP